jgi:hypothetical protein
MHNRQTDGKHDGNVRMLMVKKIQCANRNENISSPVAAIHAEMQDRFRAQLLPQRTLIHSS